VAVVSSDAAASLHYTTTGLTPTPADPVVPGSGTILVDRSLSLRARAFRSGWLPSEVVVANFSIVADAVEPVAASPAGGSYADPVTLALSTPTPGAIVRYTLDGTEPTLASPVFALPLELAGTTTLKARAFKGGWAPSPTLEQLYAVGPAPIARPVLVPPAGSYATKREVRATSATAGVTLHYTFDASEPTESSPSLPAEGHIDIDRTSRVRVRAFKPGSAPSEIATGDYLITGAVAGGEAHSLALRADGVLLSWGSNDSGQLGIGTLAGQPAPVPVSGLPEVDRVSAGRAHSLALTRDGRLWSWGSNEHGQLGDAAAPLRPEPGEVAGSWGAPIVDLAAGDEFSLALASDGSLWSWGANGDGQLADGSNLDRALPAMASTPPGLVSIAAGGGHALALDLSGQVWAWGRNADGQVGDGTTTQAAEPRQLAFAGSPAAGMARIAAGRAHSLAVDHDGGLWAWGRGFGIAPVKIADNLLVEGDGGEWHSVVRTVSGEVLGLGRNEEGQLGSGSSAARAGLEPVAGLEEDVVALAAGARHNLAITSDGVLWTWGDNSGGQLGDGTLTNRRLPVAPAISPLVANEAVALDPDADGLSTAEEFRLGTDPYNRDTNRDGIPDGMVGAGATPAGNDADGDGIPNAVELAVGLDPLKPDTDLDGFPDGADLFPLDPTRWSTPSSEGGDSTAPAITIWEPRHAVRIQ